LFQKAFLGGNVRAVRAPELRPVARLSWSQKKSNRQRGHGTDFAYDFHGGSEIENKT
jgi:hypothetical protein